MVDPIITLYCLVFFLMIARCTSVLDLVLICFLVLLLAGYGRPGSLIGDVTFESAAYVARYVMKKVTGPLAELHYERVDDVTGEVYRVEPEFNRMSLRPGIGRAWIEKFKTEVLVHDGVVSNGHLSAVPRYYDNYLRDVAEDAFVDIDVNRYRKSLRSAADGSPERLAVREQVANARLSFKRRNSV